MGASDEQIPVTGEDGEGTIGLTEKPFQVPMPGNILGAHAEMGAIAVVELPEGGVQLQVEEPGPKSWVTGPSLICLGDEATGRRECKHYAALLTEADGQVAGFEKPMQIRRFCRALASQSELMMIGEVAMYACTVRMPQDDSSAKLIRDFELKQKKQAHEAVRESGEIDL